MIAIFAFLNLAVGISLSARSARPRPSSCSRTSSLSDSPSALLRGHHRLRPHIHLLSHPRVYGRRTGSGVLWSMTYPLIRYSCSGRFGQRDRARLRRRDQRVALLPALNLARFPPLYSARVVVLIFLSWSSPSSTSSSAAPPLPLYKANDSLPGFPASSSKKRRKQTTSSRACSRHIPPRQGPQARERTPRSSRSSSSENVSSARFYCTPLARARRAGLYCGRGLPGASPGGTVNEELLAEINPLPKRASSSRAPTARRRRSVCASSSSR